MFRLLRFFSLSSFIAMALTATLLGLFFRKVEMHDLLQLGEGQNVALARALTNSLWPILKQFIHESRSMDQATIADHPVINLLNHTVRYLIEDISIVRIEILNRDGVVVFSTAGERIGTDLGREQGVVLALRGVVSSGITHNEGFSSFDGVVADRELITSYVPLRRSHDVRIDGVLELYTDVSPALRRVEMTQRVVVGGVTVVFLLLYGVLFGIVRRADRIIKEQHAQITQANEGLEQRVRERTTKLLEINLTLQEEVAQRQRSEVELRKLSRAVEQSPASVLITDTRGGIEYVNPKFCQVSGYTPEEVLGRNPSLLKSGRMVPGAYREMWETIAQGREWRGEFLNLRKNGEFYWELASISPIRDQGGRITHFVAVKEDITQRKQAEESLLRSELRLRTIMDNVAEGIVTIDAACRIDSLNPAVERFFGVEARELVGRDVAVLTTGDDVNLAIQGYLQWHSGSLADHLPLGLGGELFYERELTGVRGGGEQFPIELTMCHVSIGEGSQFIVTIRDISERKRVARELEEARQKYFQQEKMAAVGTLAAGIVHEIGNPIAALSGLVEEVGENCFSENHQGCVSLELIREQIRRLSGITRDVSEFSMPQSEEFNLLDLNGLIESTMRLMRFDKRIRRLPCELVLDRSLPATIGSGNQLRQVIINLMINAADALEGCGEREPRLTISTALEESRVRLTVADNGSGIAPDNLGKVFDAFYTTKPVGKGTGLGLSLCYSIVSNHQGTIDIESVWGEGTSVRVRLPIAVEEDGE